MTYIHYFQCIHDIHLYVQIPYIYLYVGNICVLTLIPYPLSTNSKFIMLFSILNPPTQNSRCIALLKIHQLKIHDVLLYPPTQNL